jgi:hypothetical protein
MDIRKTLFFTIITLLALSIFYLTFQDNGKRFEGVLTKNSSEKFIKFLNKNQKSDVNISLNVEGEFLKEFVDSGKLVDNDKVIMIQTFDFYNKDVESNKKEGKLKGEFLVTKRVYEGITYYELIPKR